MSKQTQNVKMFKDKSYLMLAFQLSKAKQRADKATKEYKDLLKEFKAFTNGKLPKHLQKSAFTIVNGFTHEVICTQTVQQRTKINEERICLELRVPELTLENGYRLPQPTSTMTVGKLNELGFEV